MIRRVASALVVSGMVVLAMALTAESAMATTLRPAPTSTPHGTMTPLHTITCGGAANLPNWYAGLYASGYVFCSDHPDLYSATVTLWGYYGGTYHNAAQRTRRDSPPPSYNFTPAAVNCVSGALYHTELEITAYHGNWIDEISNSASYSYC